jgi:tetratricopeptide (TPR) repeat protein
MMFNNGVLRAVSGSACVAMFALALLASAATAPAEEPAVFPLTTRSPEARRLVDEAVNLYFERLAKPEAVAKLRKAVAVDPQFAMAHELLAIISIDGSERVTEQHKAFETSRLASSSERAVIQWHQDSAERNSIDAITGMNEVAREYPRDRLVVYMCIWWLFSQGQYERALAIEENSGILDSPGMLNAKAYTYARLRRYDKAIELIAKYAASLPHDPNPEDSYGEMLRLAGRFEESIEHYRAALKIDPKFYPSQFGIADTYSLMGNQTRARQEYATGFKNSRPEELDEIQWRFREATTYVRESDWQGADGAFQAIADKERARQNSHLEADTYRLMAIYQPNPRRALDLLDKAEAALTEGKNASQRDVQQELGYILRARVEQGARLQDRAAMESSLDRLRQMAQTSNDRIIENSYHGAAGALVYAEGDFNRAIGHLEQDTSNPLSLQLLAYAYEKTGDLEGARRAARLLAQHNEATMEQAVIVPAFCKCHQKVSCDDHLKGLVLN